MTDHTPPLVESTNALDPDLLETPVSASESAPSRFPAGDSIVSARESALSVPRAGRPPDSLAEYAVEQIRNDLLMGRLRPGSRLTADAVAEQLGISHIPVREAFRFLEAQGHLQRDGRRGARVTPTSPDEATDIYLTRQILETEANRLGIPRLTAHDDARLIELIESMERASADADLRSYRVYNRAFHFISFERSERPWLVRFLRNLWDAAARYQTPLFVNGLWQVKHPLHHRSLLDALLCRDVDLVNRLMGEHRTWLIASVPGSTEQAPADSGHQGANNGHHGRHEDSTATGGGRSS
jgi:DNA-binding GntR family transcriptional regulator